MIILLAKCKQNKNFLMEKSDILIEKYKTWNNLKSTKRKN